MPRTVAAALVALSLLAAACSEPAVDDDDSAGDDDDATEPPCPPPYDESGDYGAFTVDGWPVFMDRYLLEEDPELGCAVVEHLEGDLATIRAALAPTRIDRLRTVNIWIEHTSDWPGAVYHPSAQWLSDNGYPVEWAEGIQIANARNYLDWTAVQPAIVLHELSHAWHHQVVGYDDPDLVAAYDAAMAAGLYDAVEYADGSIVEGYAVTNVQEYFAELSEAWFWVNDFEPFDREELLEHDPVGAAATEAAWAREP